MSSCISKPGQNKTTKQRGTILQTVTCLCRKAEANPCPAVVSFHAQTSFSVQPLSLISPCLRACREGYRGMGGTCTQRTWTSATPIILPLCLLHCCLAYLLSIALAHIYPAHLLRRAPFSRGDTFRLLWRLYLLSSRYRQPLRRHACTRWHVYPSAHMFYAVCGATKTRLTFYTHLHKLPAFHGLGRRVRHAISLCGGVGVYLLYLADIIVVNYRRVEVLGCAAPPQPSTLCISVPFSTWMISGHTLSRQRVALRAACLLELPCSP